MRERVEADAKLVVNILVIGTLNMDPDERKFGRGPRELTGAVDLLSHFKLQQHYDFFCKRSLPLSISDAHYLHRVVGETEIRKGEGMQLGQLVQDTSLPRDSNTRIQTFDLNVLKDAFPLEENGFVELPQSGKGEPTVPSKSKGESKYREKKHKKHKERDSEKDREHKKHKHRHKDQTKDREKDKKDRSTHPESGLDRKKHEKKRKHDGEENVNGIHRHKKSKHKSSKLDDVRMKSMASLEEIITHLGYGAVILSYAMGLDMR
ncbi:hypothetical protein SAY86_006892 [Trapa natans]|uniref:Uncharacterized protein n=1 Tax=Trapa natans TaxID=22666 RepID=A0AAN7L7H3_TRANT|nr:hypothetical protein SAY86_006892 [Trapa natans]